MYFREEFRAAVRATQAGQFTRELALFNCRVLDLATGTAFAPAHNTILVCSGGKIKKLVRHHAPRLYFEQEEPAAKVVVIDCGGRTILPGLCDAHVHATACSANLASLYTLPESLVSTRTAFALEMMLLRGFTTVRDAGGADWGLAQSCREGTIAGPTLLFTGHALSQTGGHGDFRAPGEDCMACGAALRGIGRVCDGEAEVRRAARDELRKGAHCIKIMASGGVSSPTDALTNTQFSLGEITAAVEEAAANRTYVAAHAYHPDAIMRVVRCGARSVEHGNYLDAATAGVMAERGAFLVPTIITYARIQEHGAASGMDPALVAKVGDLVEAGLRSLVIAREAGVKMAYGSDLLGDMQSDQLRELALRARVLDPIDVLRSATINCAELFNLEHRIGKLESGYDADFIVVDGKPERDLTPMMDEDSVHMVFKGGLMVKGPEHMRQTNNMLHSEVANAKLQAHLSTGLPSQDSRSDSGKLCVIASYV